MSKSVFACKYVDTTIIYTNIYFGYAIYKHETTTIKQPRILAFHRYQICIGSGYMSELRVNITLGTALYLPTEKRRVGLFTTWTLEYSSILSLFLRNISLISWSRNYIVPILYLFDPYNRIKR